MFFDEIEGNRSPISCIDVLVWPSKVASCVGVDNETWTCSVLVTGSIIITDFLGNPVMTEWRHEEAVAESYQYVRHDFVACLSAVPSQGQRHLYESMTDAQLGVGHRSSPIRVRQ